MHRCIVRSEPRTSSSLNFLGFPSPPNVKWGRRIGQERADSRNDEFRAFGGDTARRLFSLLSARDVSLTRPLRDRRRPRPPLPRSPTGVSYAKCAMDDANRNEDRPNCALYYGPVPLRARGSAIGRNEHCARPVATVRAREDRGARRSAARRRRAPYIRRGSTQPDDGRPRTLPIRRGGRAARPSRDVRSYWRRASRLAAGTLRGGGGGDVRNGRRRPRRMEAARRTEAAGAAGCRLPAVAAGLPLRRTVR